MYRKVISEKQQANRKEKKKKHKSINRELQKS